MEKEYKSKSEPHEAQTRPCSASCAQAPTNLQEVQEFIKQIVSVLDSSKSVSGDLDNMADMHEFVTEKIKILQTTSHENLELVNNLGNATGLPRVVQQKTPELIRHLLDHLVVCDDIIYDAWNKETEQNLKVYNEIAQMSEYPHEITRDNTYEFLEYVKSIFKAEIERKKQAKNDANVSKE